MASSTMARLVAVHFWPVEKNAALTTFSTAELKSASASTMVGFFPPISSWMRSAGACWPAACSQSPISQDPVKEMAFSRLRIDQSAAQLSAGTGDEIDHALGNAGLMQRLDDAPRAERRGGCGLNDHGVAADQRRRQLPRRDRGRENSRA